LTLPVAAPVPVGGLFFPCARPGRELLWNYLKRSSSVRNDDSAADWPCVAFPGLRDDIERYPPVFPTSYTRRPFCCAWALEEVFFPGTFSASSEGASTSAARRNSTLLPRISLGGVGSVRSKCRCFLFLRRLLFVAASDSLRCFWCARPLCATGPSA